MTYRPVRILLIISLIIYRSVSATNSKEVERGEVLITLIVPPTRLTLCLVDCKSASRVRKRKIGACALGHTFTRARITYVDDIAVEEVVQPLARATAVRCVWYR